MSDSLARALPAPDSPSAEPPYRSALVKALQRAPRLANDADIIANDILNSSDIGPEDGKTPETAVAIWTSSINAGMALFRAWLMVHYPTAKGRVTSGATNGVVRRSFQFNEPINGVREIFFQIQCQSSATHS